VSGPRGTLELVLDQLSAALSPLSGELSPGAAPEFLASLGVVVPPAQAASVAGPLDAFCAGLAQLLHGVNGLNQAVASGNTAAILQEGIAAAAAFGEVAGSFDTLASKLSAFDKVPVQGQDQSPVQALATRLVNRVLADWLGRTPGLNEVLELLQVLERADENVASQDPANPFHTVDTFHFGKLGEWLEQPRKTLESTYEWGTPQFGVKLLRALEKAVGMQGLPALYDASGPVPVLQLMGMEVRPHAELQPGGVGFRLTDDAKPLAWALSGDGWTLTAQAAFPLASGSELVVQSNGAVTLHPADATKAAGKLRVAFTRTAPANAPLVLLGIAGGSRVEVGEITASAEVELKGAGATSTGTLSVGGALKGGRAVISAGEGDGFLAKLLSGLAMESRFDLGFSVSGADGVHFHGSGGLEIQLPTHVALGPVELSALTLSLRIEGASFPVYASTDIRASLGPLEAVVEGVGMKAAIELKGGTGGNLGPLDLSLAFKPPRGVGLKVDAGVVVGGGYLYFDAEREEYAGALELEFMELVSLKAVGLITTRMPDGSKGFSLLIIITAEFGSGIQLGFGFTLLAVGGLLGLNRTMKLQPLMEGVRTGSIESIMFPKDVVKNAPKIISDLRKIFPPHEGRFLIGPMAKLGWGTPALVSLSLGIIIEVPGNIAILGVLRLALPADDAALIVLQVNFAGAIEFDRKRTYFFASLFDSRVLFITIEGEMGLLAAFGDDANFVLSVGGFHPRFNPPPLPFPNPKRVAVNILNTDIARIRVEGYFAVTSNSVQFGARAELFFGFSAFNVHGEIGFDALFQFSPFFFVVEVYASFGVTAFGIGLLSVDVRMSLEGPAPWRARGTGEISILFFTLSVDFDVSWGEARDTTLPPIQVMPLVAAELAKAESWRALLPKGNHLLVSLRKLPPEETALVLHPVGTLRVSQRAVPLGLHLDKVGNQKPSDANRLELSVSKGGLAKRADVMEQFAPAQFQALADADRLSRPAYGREPGGLELSVAGGQLASTRVVKRRLRYDLLVFDTNRKAGRQLVGMTVGTFGRLSGYAAINRNPLSRYQDLLDLPYPADRVETWDDGYVVAWQADNGLYGSAQTFASEASAREFLSAQVTADPALADALHVIPAFEMAA
jgi:hypothetical protein